MISVSGVTFKSGTEEELLPQFHPSFPCISTCLEFEKDEHQSYPWHWHKAVEIFYVERGLLVHSTPFGELTFPAGSAAIINANILHSAKAYASDSGHRRMHHLFDPSLIAGAAGSRIEKNYVIPFLTASHIEIIPLTPDNPSHAELLSLIRESFQLSSEQMGYELHIRNVLTEIWLNMLKIIAPQLSSTRCNSRPSDLIKQMLIYIHEHYSEKITVSDIAQSANISDYICSNVFQKCLHTTPSEYLNTYRMRIAYQLLAQTDDSVSAISAACGMNNSYFSKVFRQTTGYTPLEYRRFYQRQENPKNFDTSKSDCDKVD